MSGARLLLLPGLDGTGRLFTPFAAELQRRGFQVDPRALPDRPDYGLDDYVFDLESTWTSGPSWVVAESFSGPLALALASRGRVPVLGLVLVATFRRPPAPRALLRVASRLPLGALPAVGVKTFLTGGHDEGLVAAVVGAVRSTSEATLRARLRLLAALPEFPKPTLPTLLVAAGRDRLVLRDDWWPGAERVVVDGPHLLLQTRPLEVARVVAEFLSRSRPPQDR